MLKCHLCFNFVIKYRFIYLKKILSAKSTKGISKFSNIYSKTELFQDNNNKHLHKCCILLVIYMYEFLNYIPPIVTIKMEV